MRANRIACLAALIATTFGCSDSPSANTTEITVDVRNCLGDGTGFLVGVDGELLDRQTTCASGLGDAISEGPVNACLVVREAGSVTSSYIALRWSPEEHALRPVGDSTLAIEPGRQVDAALFFGSDGFNADLCVSQNLRVDDPCEAERLCVLKLIQPRGAVGEGSVIRFVGDGGRCQSEWRPELYDIAATEVCDGLDNDCDGAADEGIVGLGEQCSDGVGVCERNGVVECGDDGSVVCTAVPGEADGDEVCDGLDNNCDGRIDEQLADCCDVNAVRECGMNTGVCSLGRQTCNESRAWGPCSGVEPTPETCDDRDNDCDGDVDEDLRLDGDGPQVGEDCEVGLGECTAIGIVACAQGRASCQAGAGSEPGVERCDGLDNDCDGSTDEDFERERQDDPGDFLNDECQAGRGGCAQSSAFVCTADGAGVICGAVPGVPEMEFCGDNLDNDCDERTDEGFDNLGEPCSTGVGICRRSGQLICDVQNPIRSECGVAPGLPELEACNLLDDDCDERIDEDFILASDDENCGSCGVRCGRPNAATSCFNSECVLEGCINGFENIDGDPTNGCECREDLAEGDECNDPQQCMPDGLVTAEPCGNGGARERTCVGGVFEDWNDCEGEVDDVCESPAFLVDGPPACGRFAFDTTGRANLHGASCGNEAASGESLLRLSLLEPAELDFEIVEANYDTVIFVRGECQDRRSELGCNDDGERNDTRSSLSLNLEAGVYFVFVDGFGDESAGNSTLLISSPEAGCDAID